MLVLFLVIFLAAVTFILVFLWKLPEDTKSKSIRSLFFLLFAIGFWVATLPAMLAPEPPSAAASPSYNVIITNASSSGNIIISTPAYTTNTLSSISVRDYNAFFYVWLAVLMFLLFVTLIWYINVFRRSAIEALHEGRDVMEEYERKNKL